MGILVFITAGDRILYLLRLSDLSLDGRDPAVAVCEAGSLEGMLVAVKVEEKVDSSLVRDIGGIGLKMGLD